MTKIKTAALAFCLIGGLPMVAAAQTLAAGSLTPVLGPSAGDREFSISGTGAGDKGFNSGAFGISGDYGWYQGDNVVIGVRQSINYASISGASLRNDFWNGSTRAYANYQFLNDALQPFVGGSLGAVYGDGIQNSAFAGLEGGVKYYLQPKAYLLSRVEYQFMFESSSEVADAFQENGVLAYTVGLGVNF